MVTVEMVVGIVEPFAKDKMKKGLEIVKNGKASEPTEIVKEHLVASPYLEQVILQIENEIFDEKICLMTGRREQFSPFIRRKVTL